ncbi:MAG TPA: hypothetical protein VF326_11280 [Anaerolineaceae bacterium]
MVCALIFGVAACSPAAVSSTPELRRVEVTRVETRVVTAEVTRVLEVPVTDTPTPVETATPPETPTRTRVLSPTPTLELPRVSILETSACMYGPGTVYLFKYGLNATVWMRVLGRNEDGSWLLIRAGDDPDSNACWIKATLVKFLSGEIKNVPVFWIGLPYSTLYLPPTQIRANRAGNEVTIFWMPVYMTEDDYRGYLIEAWVCQGGKQVLVPIKYETTFDQNSSMISVKVMDELGCDVPSRARLYAVEKHGYTNYQMVPWPGFDQTATPVL